jgi:hypothetical protein
LTLKNWFYASLYIAVFLLGFDFLKARRLERPSLAGRLLRRLKGIFVGHSN